MVHAVHELRLAWMDGVEVRDLSPRRSAVGQSSSEDLQLKS